MDVGSLSTNGAVQSQSLSCVYPPLAPQSASLSMGDQHPLAADAAADTEEKSASNNMVVSHSEERSDNFYNYKESAMLANKGLKDVEDSVTNDDTSLGVTPLEMEAASPVKGGNSDGGAGSDCEEDPVECGDCNRDFLTLQQYMDHSCARLDSKDPNFADNESEMSDGESFNGKIVYNPDGSAYIIEGSDSEISDLDLDVPKQDGAIIDKKGLSPTVPTLHPISNAFFVPRNPSSFLNSYCNTSSSSQKLTHEAPIMHSYRVYDVRSGKDLKSGEESSDSSHSNENHMPSSTSSSSAKSEALTVPTKPILMCFICKLSFGFAKSFTAHATTEHSMHLNQEERTIMSQKNASAIIQGVGKGKRPLMSFLEPMPAPASSSSASFGSKSPSFMCANALSSNSKQESTTVSYVYTKPKISLPSALENQSANDSVSSKHVNSWVTNSQSAVKSEDVDGNKENSDSNGKDSDQEEPLGSSQSAEDSSVKSTKVKGDPESPKVNSEKLKLPGEGNADTTASTSTINSSSVTSVPSPSLVNSQTFTGFLGMCDEHPQGRAQGVECPKCDMILSSSQSLGGHMTMMHSRNSCKTLKCPKCNWHYKYQETLEIHMKEKHPDNDTQCIYCITNQAHPRLARGETYSCGYKPYRCEVCNYSTTTKGNLSIHMQSDKHINNMQDLANGSNEIKMPPQQSPFNNNDDSQYKKAKPKQTWRCDVCNYETTVARNLRIHMTSEKHTHNMMVLQQNMKHMQRDMHIQMNQLMMLGQQDPAMFGLPSPMSGGMFPFDQQVLMAGLPPGFEVPVNLTKENGTAIPQTGSENIDSSKLYQCCVCNIFSTDSLEALHQHLQHDRSKQRENEHIVVNNGTYMCNLCTYKTNLKANFQLHCKTDKHIQRLQLVNHIKEGGSNNEWRLKYLNVSNPIQVRCNCCDYYTNSIHKLQMHGSNLQHEGSAQLFRHLQGEEAKLSGASPKYYQCTVCLVSTRTKLRLIQHVHSMKHLQAENQVKVQAQETGTPVEDLANLFVVKELTDGESIDFDDEDGDRDVSERATTGEDVPDNSEKQRPEGSSSSASLGPSTSVTTTPKTSSPVTSVNAESNETSHMCPLCTFSSTSESSLQAHVLAQHKQQEILCPLCQDGFKVKAKLERHLMQSHNVTAEGLQRLLLIVDANDWIPSAASQEKKDSESPSQEYDETREINVEAMEIEHSKIIAEAIDVSSLLDKSDGDNQYRCQTCSKTFAIIDQLYAHQNELGHLELKQTPRGPGYLCWKKGCNQYFKTAQALQVHFREIHAKRVAGSGTDFTQYSHHCSQCTLAFKSADKLQMHTQFHLLWFITNCGVCSKSFHSIASHRKHLEAAHSDLGKAELDKHIETLNSNAKAWHECADVLEPKLKQSSSSFGALMATKMANSSPSLSCSPSSEDRDATMQDDAIMDDNDNDLETSCSDSATDLENGAMFKDSAKFGDDKCDSDRGDSSSTYREQQFMEDFINSQAMAEGSYEDPGRKYKCHRCKVAFTKQNYLTAHNKTLQHRRGDKLSYPIERYLDPNRPFKCDVCKESFTQKNILLVHYNSVSHLHKLKQAAQQGNLPPSISASPPTSSTSTATTSSSAVSADSEKKPYRCNICKVAYNQGSTLDIHIRSVAHQTRASKIHELAMTGQIDINLPLIEQPDLTKSSQQQAQLFADILQQQQTQVSVANSLQQQSLLFPGLPNSLPGLNPLSQLPVLPGMPLPSSMLTPPTTSSPQVTTSSSETSTSQKVNGEMLEKVVEKLSRSSEGKKSELKVEVKKEPAEQAEDFTHKSDSSSKVLEEKENMVNAVKTSSKITEHSESSTQGQPSYCCQRCNSTFISQDALSTHQQIYCFLGAGANSLATQAFNRSRFMGRFKPQVHKNLLENIGFECVMQFNEYNQRKSVKKETDDKEEKKDDINTDDKEACEQEEMWQEVEDDSRKDKPDLPEINKCSCIACGKDFSSVWVLKAHQEEVHRKMVPIEAVENFGEKFKTDFDKKQPKEEALPTTPQPGSSTPGSSGSSSDKPGSQEMPPPPPPPPPVSLSNQFDMASLMPMFGMMPMPLPVNLMTLGMHPPLMPMMMHGMDMQGFSPQVQVVDPNYMSQQQLQQAQNQKRVRTRISDEQLKILRGYFDINNSPSEEQIQQMSDQSGLPPKVIKHWFRNTLFKERQRNKDSPYNFNNPPSTSIDLEEYEKTGKIPEIKSEPKDDYEDDDDLRDDQPSDNEADKTDRYESLFKLETPKPEHYDDKNQFETYSNASTPSTTSSIPSTPTASVPNTPTPTTTPTSEDHTFMRNDGGSSGKRANRTRFTDFQIKLLQEYFEQNAYPKDDELDHLSKLLNLSPRVIVVWFQNARQKARKIYENQPAADAKEGNTPFQRTPGLNYQCKKCNAVFQRYYELIKHQKRPCIAENNNNNSVSNVDDDSNSTIMSQDDLSQTGSITETKEQQQQPQQQQQQTQQQQKDVNPQTAAFKCDKCDASFNRLDLWQEHLKIHSMNPSLFSSFPSSSAFGMLQTLAHQEDSKAAAAAAAAKRKLMAQDTDEEKDDQPRDKRLRTTILPEQLDYLYQKYQLDCNPSRKQLESIAAEVGLKKRVVQVWFQNTRARERKGQYRAHQQLIHKRCPFCRALFRAKSALESHLATKHAEEMAKVEINVDAIPDASMDSNPTSPQPMSASTSGIPPPGTDLNKLLSLSPAGMQQLLPFMPPSSLGMPFPQADPLQLSMNKIYEDSLKKYINELSGPSQVAKSRHSSETSSSRKSETESRVPTQVEDDAPLDLSKPIKVNTETDKCSDGPLTDMSERSDDHHFNRRVSMDDSISETYSDFDNSTNEDVNSSVNSPPSPNSYHVNQPNKRYRTQMTSLQVRVMKSLFQDYKTPTMAECELLGREIGLPKRVVQVWFQNARAKEKKSKLAYAKTFGSDVDFSKPPEECSLCNFKYSHKFTIQDHIFTRKHIDNVKAFIQSQSDAEREMSDPTGMSTLLRQQREMDRVRKAWDDASSTSASTTTTPHLAQLQAMGMNAIGLPASAGGNSSSLNMSTGHLPASSSSRKSNRSNEETAEKKESRSTASRSSSSSSKSQQQQQQQQDSVASVEMAMNMQMMSALGGYIPGMDPSYLPFMYPGLPGYMPGMGMPLLQPGLMPGAEHMMAYDPLSFGTPLPLLQIPQDAIKNVSEMLTDPKSSLAQYTQDSKSVSTLKNQVSSVDYACAQESTVDVGYICKKCQMVYPAKEACITHQRAVCFAGAKVSENMKPMLKLEQKQYECRACTERFSTAYEYKLHTQMEVHKVKATKLYQRKSEGSSSTAGSSPAKSRPVSVPSESRRESASEELEPKPKKPKIE
ncbi:zinc finger homeobox protein 4-like isoform X2 [Haliotis asinina]|uniref:zinc finger homeobox protein 4-like isoform X2 n=1 Tax=Haliotis asinina TaxID=109174 RepID=UPI0035322ADD